MEDDISKKLKRDLGQMIGRISEDLAITRESVTLGKEVRRTGVGSDFKEKDTDIITGHPASPWRYHEVKTGKSQLTKRQRQESKKRGKNYIEERY